jgi:hypothetical protein
MLDCPPPVVGIIRDNMVAKGNPLGLPPKAFTVWTEGMDLPALRAVRGAVPSENRHRLAHRRTSERHDEVMRDVTARRREKNETAEDPVG